MIVVHHLEKSRSHRILWLLEELELEYEVERYARVRGRSPESLKAVHPLGKSPVIEHDGRVVAESGAIVEYLVELSEGKLRPPPTSEEARRYTFWLHFAEGTMMTPLIVKLITNRVRKAVPLLGRAFGASIDKAFTDAELLDHLRFVEGQLQDRRFLCGDELTAADTLMIFPLQASLALPGLGDRFDRVRAYVTKLEARPAYRRALERGGTFSLLTR